jgi:hypothetical protein
MPTDQTAPQPPAQEAGDNREAGKRPLTPAAQRAVAEAAARRAAERDGKPAKPLKEVDGRGGLDPIRYGDWEVNGLASDF